MRRFVFVIIVVFVALSFAGCGGVRESQISQQTVYVPGELLAGDATIRLNVITTSEQTSLKANTDSSSVSVTCAVKLLRPEDPTKFDELVKTANVNNGSADFVFNSIPARSALVKLTINGGSIGGYAKLHGAKDLTAGENSVDIAGVGSNLRPDIVVATVENLVSKGDLTTNIDNNIVANIESAYTTTASVAGTSVPNLVENVSQVYLANISQPLPKQDEISGYLNQFTKTTSILPDAVSTVNTNAKAALRAGIYSWSWDSTYNNWYYYTPGYYSDEGMLLTFCFKDSYNNQYATIDAAPGINKIGIGSAIYLRTVYGLAKYVEVYDFTPMTSDSYEISGLYTLKVGETYLLIGNPDKILVSLNNPYPLSGEFIMLIPGLGGFSIIFNGTCVADVFYAGDDGTTGSSKVIITPSFIGSFNLRANTRFSSEQPSTALITEMQQNLANSAR